MRRRARRNGCWWSRRRALIDWKCDSRLYTPRPNELRRSWTGSRPATSGRPSSPWVRDTPATVWASCGRPRSWDGARSASSSSDSNGPLRTAGGWWSSWAIKTSSPTCSSVAPSSSALSVLYQQEESVAWTGSRIRPYERQRHLKLYQQAFDTLHHATQLYPESEERLKKEADVIKPHLEWLTALPDELCIKVFGFLSKKQLHKVSMVCRHWYRLASDDSIWRLLVHDYEPDAQIHNDAVGQDYAWKRTYERLTRDWQVGEQMSSALTELFSPCRFISTRFERVQPNQLLSITQLTEDLGGRQVPLEAVDEVEAWTLLEKIVVDHVVPICFMAFEVGEWLQHLWDLMPPPRRFFTSLSKGKVQWHNGARTQVWVCVTPLYTARVLL